MEELKKEPEHIEPNPRVVRFMRYFLGLSVVFLVGILGGYVGSRYTGTSNGGLLNIGQRTVKVTEESDTIKVGEKVNPSVVSITGELAQMDFFGQVRSSKSSGTGFIVSEDGLIATNKHVVAEAKSFSVFTNDGKEYKATVKAIDPYFDIALLKIEAKGLKPVEFGDSDAIKVGQRVIAIGNALGQFSNTLTAGVVSAIGRAIEAGDASGSSSEVLENLIQTDAAINSGNSGGPLLNIAGQVIGMNTAVASGAEGIGFSIPVNLVRSAIISYQKNNKIVRPMIGVRYITITKELAARNDLAATSGALIYSQDGNAVSPGSAAARAGLKSEDIIIKVNNDRLGEGKSLVGVVSKYQPGDKVILTYLRDGKEKTVEITLGSSS